MSRSHMALYRSRQPMDPPKLKHTLRATSSAPAIFTGGPIATSGDFEVLACTASDVVNLVDPQTGRIIQKLDGDSDLVTAIAMHPRKKCVVTASRSLLIHVWELPSGEKVKTFKAHNGVVLDMAFDATGTLLATAGADRHVLVWDVEKGYCTHNFRGHTGIVTRVAFHPDPHRLQLVSGSEDGTARVWDLVTRQHTELNSHVSSIGDIAFSPDGWSLFTAGRDKVVCIWNLRDNSLVRTVPVYEVLESIVILPQNVTFPNRQGVPATKKKGGEKGQLVFVTAGDKGVLRFWDAQTGGLIYEQEKDLQSAEPGAVVAGEKAEPGAAYNKPITKLCYASKAGQVMTVTVEHDMMYFDLEKMERSRLLVGFNDEIIDLKYCKNESALAVATNSEQLRLFDVETFSCNPLYGHSNIILCLDTSADGLHVVSGSRDQTVRVWNLEHHTCVGLCVGHTEPVGAVAFARRSKAFAVSGSKDKTLKVWDLTALPADKISQPRAKLSVKAHDKDINTVAVAPNDKLIASGSQDRTIKLWNAQDMSLKGVLTGHKRGVWCVEFSPVDQCVVSSSGDKTIKIWSVTDMRCLKTFEGHTNSVLKVSFITQGMQLVSTGSDGLLKLWTIKTNECVETFDGHEDKVWAMTVKKGGDQVVTGGADSLINIWTDFTSEEDENKAQALQEKILQEQDLSNALREKQYGKAIKLAFRLEQPFRLLKVFEEVFALSDGGDLVVETMSTFSPEMLNKCLLYARDWNTNARNTSVAQNVLGKVFTVFDPSVLLQCPDIKQVLEGLIPYTDRHFARVEKLCQKSHLIDYTLNSMDVFLPTLDIQEENDAKANGTTNHRAEAGRKPKKDISADDIENDDDFVMEEINDDDDVALGEKVIEVEETPRRSERRRRKSSGASDGSGSAKKKRKATPVKKKRT